MRTILAVTNIKQNVAHNTTNHTQNVWRKGDLCLLTTSRPNTGSRWRRLKYTRNAGMMYWMPVPAYAPVMPTSDSRSCVQKATIYWNDKKSAERVVKHAACNEIFSRGVKALNDFTVISTCTQPDIISRKHANRHASDVMLRNQTCTTRRTAEGERHVP